MNLYLEDKTVKVLVIDDNYDNHISLKAILTDAFEKIVIYSSLDGLSGVEMAREHDPDVILLDILMPGMDGFEVCKILKDDEFLTEIPVVFFTALKADKQSRIRGLEAGAEAFISKPIDESELIAQIRAMVKIKSINTLKRDENERLAALVSERTRQLESTHYATLNLLEDLQKENDSRKKTEEALSISEALYRSIVIASPDNTTVTDLDGNIIMISPSGLDVLEINHPEELIGKNIVELLAPEDKQKGIDNFRRILEGVNLGPEEYVVLSKTGKRLDAEINGELFRNQSNEPTGFVFIVRDITERKKQQKLLQESEALYRAILDASPDSIAITDLEGNFVMASPSAFHTFNVDESVDLTKYNLQDFLHADDKERMKDDLGLMLKGIRTGTKEYKIVNTHGQFIDLEIKGGYIYDTNGRIARLLFLARDITERNETNEKIKHISRLYAFLGQINQAVVRINDEKELLSKICEVAVEYGEFRMAWVGLFDDADTKIKLHTKAGYDDGYLEMVIPSLLDDEAKKGPLYHAINHQKVYFTNDIQSNTALKKWKNEALLREYKSMVNIPLKKRNKVIGVLNIYASEVGFFNNEDEQKLIYEIYEDISFALTNIELNEIRKQIEQNLFESENRYNTFINNNVDLIFVKDENLRYVVLNDAMANFFGKVKSDIINKTDSELAAEKLISPCLESDKKALLHDGVSVFYEELGGRIFETTKFRMKLRNGKYGVGGILHDITQRRKSEIALEESRLELKAIYDNAPVMLCVVDEQFRILYQNKEFENFVKQNDLKIQGELIGNVIGCIESVQNEYGCGGGEKCHECSLRSALKKTLKSTLSQQNIEYHTTISKNNATKAIDLLGSSAMFDSLGKKKILLCLFDITERRNAEKALQKSEMFLRTFIDNAPFQIWARDLDNVGILENKMLVEKFGSIIGKKPSNHSNLDKDVALLWEKNNQRVMKGEMIDEEIEYKLTNQSVDYHQIIFPINNNEEIIGIAGFNIDITEKKKTDNALKESQRQLKSYAAHLQKVREEERNLLAREIHDDLGQILVGLKIDIGLLKSRLSAYLAKGTHVLESELIKLSDLVNTTIKTTRRIISDLRPEALEELGLVDAFKHHIQAFETRYSIPASYRFNKNIVDLEGDRAVALFRILQESLNNVAKHANATKVEINLLVEDNNLILEILDNGIGFEMSKKNRIDSYGLIGMKERANILDAELKITSNPGKGTLVFVKIPL